MDPISKNVLIENITPEVSTYINWFCDKHKKNIIVVPTEFLELSNGFGQSISINGELIREFQNGSSELSGRLKGLSDIRENIEAFVSLANQPSLDEYCDVFDVGLSFNLGLPEWEVDLTAANHSRYDYDLYFSGNVTSYREDQLRLLTSRFNVLCERRFVSESERIRQLKTCRFNLNIIQHASWKWLSTMRVLFGLRNGKLTFQPSVIPMAPLSDFVIELTHGSDLLDLFEARLERYKSPFSLLDLNSGWRVTQKEFISFCLG